MAPDSRVALSEKIGLATFSVSTVDIAIAEVFFNVVRARNFFTILVFQAWSKAELQSWFKKTARACLVLIIIIEVKAWLHQLVHLFLIGALVLEPARVVTRSKVYWFVSLVFIVIEHSLEATFLLFFVVLATTERS